MNELLWWTSRGTGVVAFVALTASLLLGVLARSGRGAPGLGRYGVHELHRTVALTAVGLLAVHVVTIVSDAVSGVTARSALVPFTSAYAPLWVGLGVLGTYVLVVGAGTGLLRGRLTTRGFAVLHGLTYLAWPLAALHFLGAGTDGHTPWAWALTGGCTAALLLALGWRLTPSVRARGHRRLPRHLPLPVAGPARVPAEGRRSP